MWVFASLLLGLLPPETGPYKLYLEGKQGFLYSLQVDRDSQLVRSESGELAYDNPVMLNGSPLYIGRKSVGGPEIKITLQQLYRDSLLEDLPEKQVEQRSERLSSAFQVRIHPSVLVNFLNYLQNNRDVFRQSVSHLVSSKTTMMERLLFDDEFILTDQDLRSLRQSDYRSIPPPIEFSIENLDIPLNLEEILRSQVDFPKSEWVSDILEALNDPASDAFNSVWGMSVVIQVDRLSFHIREKRIFFDPETQRLRIDIVTDKTQVSGPLKEIGEMKRFFNWRGHEEDYRLESGEIGGMLLSLGLELKRESPDFWVLTADPQFFTLSFLDSPPQVSMHIKGTSSKGVPKDTSQTTDLKGRHEVTVSKTIASTMTQALTTRFFSDTIALDLKKQAWREGAEEVNLKAWVEDYKFHKDGVDILFDTQFEVSKIADCVEALEPPRQNLTTEFPALAREAGARWGYVWNRDERDWKFVRFTGEPPYAVEEGPPQIDLAHHLGFLEWVFRSAWYAGEFCFDTSMWWPRPAETPKMQLRLLEPPQIHYLSDQVFELVMNAEITRYERDVTESQDHFDRVSSRRAFKSSIKFSPANIEFDWKSLETNIEGFNESENDLVRKVAFEILKRFNLMKDFETANPDMPHFSLRAWLENLGRGGIKLKAFEGTQDRWLSSVQLTDFDKIFKFSSPERVPTPIEKRALHTQVVQRPSYWVEDPLVELAWSSGQTENGALFYSWQLVGPHQNPDEVEWSSFDSRNKIQFLLSEKGLYQFQVRAMNRYFEIEFPSQEIVQFYYLGIEENEDNVAVLGTEASESPTESEEAPAQTENSQEAKTEVHRAESKGAFGCSTNSGESRGSRFPLSLLILSLVFLLVMRRRFSVLTPKP